MDYQWYKSDIDQAWLYKINGMWNKIAVEVEKKTSHLFKTPNFGINYDLNYRLGEWQPDTRTIVLSANLLKRYEENAVEYVLRHEIAHQLVDEYFAIQGKPHGEVWEKACNLVNIDPSRVASSDILKNFKGIDINPTVEKIRKLIIHGNDDAITKEESGLFLSKAQELMIKHKIEMRAIQGDNGKKFYVTRPVGPLINRHNSWLNAIAYFVAENYGVLYIWSYCNRKRRIEFFGDPDSLDIAEYVFHALLNQAEILWQQYKKEHQEKIKTDSFRKENCPYGKLHHRISKNAFFQGLIIGYEEKMSKGKQNITSQIKPEDEAMILASDKMLEEAFENKYHPKNFARTYLRGQGYSDGRSLGVTMSLSQGVTGGNNNGRFLN